MIWIVAGWVLASGVAWQAGAALPIPSGAAIKQRLMSKLKQSEDARENYSCTVRERVTSLREDGSAKKVETSRTEQFFVHGIEVEHLLEKDGKPLSAGAAENEQKRVDKKVRQFSDEREAAKVHAKGERQADLFLRALQLQHGRREERSGRPTLVYDLAGDPAFKPRQLEERFAQALTGTVAVDEGSGEPVELFFKTYRDVKIGGGLLANLHKGFFLHLQQARQPDGVWLLQRLEGSGDAQAALFLRERFRYERQTEACHLFSVTTDQHFRSANGPVVPPVDR